LSHALTRCWKEFDEMCIHFDTIPECDRQTDRQTDRFAITISRCACVTVYADGE